MAFSLSGKAEIDASEFNKNLKLMTAKSKALDAEMKALAAEFKNEGKSLKDSAKGREAATKAIKAQQEKAKLLADQIALLQKEGKGETEECYKLQQQLAKTNQTIASYSAETDKAGKETAVSTGQLIKAGAALGALKVAASAVVGAIKGIAKAAVGAAKGVWNLGVSSGQWADALLTDSNKMGVDAETLQEWQYAARFIDMDVSAMSKSWFKLDTAIGKASKTKKKDIVITKKLRVATKNANGTDRDKLDIFYDTIDALHSMSNETARNNKAREIFGAGYKDILPLINSGTAAIRAYGQEAREMGVIISADNVTALGKFDDTMQKFDATTQAIKTNLAVAFLPVLELVAGKLTEFSGKVSEILSDGFQKEDVGKIIDAFFEMFDLDNGDQETEGASVGEFIGELIGLIRTKVDEHEDDIKTIAGKIGKFFADGLRHAFGLRTPEEKKADVLAFAGLDESELTGDAVQDGKKVMDGYVQGMLDYKYPSTFEEAFKNSLLGKIISAIKGTKDDPALQSGETAVGGDFPTFFAQGVEDNQQPVSEAGETTIGTVEEKVGGPSTSHRSRQWGKELAEGFSRGIRDGIPEVSAASDALAAAAAAPIHFSLPDYGILRDVGSWGGEMIDKYVTGIKRNLYKVDAVMGGAVNSATMGGRTTNYGGVSINVYGAAGQDVNALADVIMVKMQNAVNRREAVFA